MTKESQNKYEVSPYERHNLQVIADSEQEPIVFADVIREMGLSGPRLEAKQLIGETFQILRAKPFESAFDTANKPWFCVVKLSNDPDPYTVVIGGGACTEMLEAFAQAEITRPLQVTLDWVEGGKYGGYYQFK